MKRFSKNPAWLICFTALLLSCNQDKEEFKTDRIIVTGNILNYDKQKADFTYTKYELLSSSETSEVQFDTDGSFKMELKSDHPLKGFFSLGKEPTTYEFDFINVDGRDSSSSVGSFDFKMIYLYLEPGDSVIMNLDYTNIPGSFSFSGQGADNNLLINEEEIRFNSYKHKFLRNYYNITFREPNDYKKTVNKLRDDKLKFIDSLSGLYKISSQLTSMYRADCQNSAISSKMFYPESHKGFNDGKPAILPEDYIDFMDEAVLYEQIGDKGIGHFYFLKSWLRKKYEISISEENEVGDYYDYVKSQLGGRIYYEFLALTLSRDFRKILYDNFNENCPYPEIARLVKEKYKHLEGMLEGNPAPDFNLVNVNGDKVSLHDLKGKYIYIDFWATWCGPCIKEIPSLKKLEEKYKGGNISFVSISFDKESDTEKWRNYVIDNDLTGIQLIADKKNNDILSTAFNINLIPRFVFLDTIGNIIDANAPRPSDHKIIELFDKNGVGN